MFDPAKAAAYKGKVTDYDSPIYIADAALYLKAHKPDLGITDVYELTQPQFDAAVQLLKDQHPFVGKYWGTYPDNIDFYTNGTSTVGTTWPYQVNYLKSQKIKVEGVVPTEGMTGWADTWMMSAHAKHPNCMYKWMAWMVTPNVQAQVAESFGESPANPKACHAPRQGGGRRPVRAGQLLHRVPRERQVVLRRDRVLEDAPGGLRRQPWQDLHRLLGLDPEMDRDPGLR